MSFAVAAPLTLLFIIITQASQQTATFGFMEKPVFNYSDYRSIDPKDYRKK